VAITMLEIVAASLYAGKKAETLSSFFIYASYVFENHDRCSPRQQPETVEVSVRVHPLLIPWL
jgi:hypothetical protein